MQLNRLAYKNPGNSSFNRSAFRPYLRLASLYNQRIEVMRGIVMNAQAPVPVLQPFGLLGVHPQFDGRPPKSLTPGIGLFSHPQDVALQLLQTVLVPQYALLVTEAAMKGMVMWNRGRSWGHVKQLPALAKLHWQQQEKSPRHWRGQEIGEDQISQGGQP